MYGNMTKFLKMNLFATKLSLLTHPHGVEERDCGDLSYLDEENIPRDGGVTTGNVLAVLRK